MSISIYSNIPANRAAYHIKTATEAVNRSLERISTGKQIVTAADDPSRLYRAAIYSREAAMYNKVASITNESESMVGVALEALDSDNGIASILEEMETLAEEAASNNTLTTSQIASLQEQMEELIDDIDRISQATYYNSMKVIDGSRIAQITNTAPDSFYVRANDIVQTGIYRLRGSPANYHQVIASQSPLGEVSRLTNLHESATVVSGYATAGITITGTAVQTAKYEIIFMDEDDFTIFNSSGATVGEGVVNSSAVTLSGETDLAIQITANGSTPSEGFKYNWTVTAGGTGELDIGNRQNFEDPGNDGTLSAVSLAEDAVLYGTFSIRYSYVNNGLQYNIFNNENEAQGNWTQANENFTAFSDSDLRGSVLKHYALNTATGDRFDFDYSSYSGIATAGGTFEVSVGISTQEIQWTPDQTLAEITENINSAMEDYLTAEMKENVGGTTLFTLVSRQLGNSGKIALTDTAGNFVSILQLEEVANTGQQASLVINDTTYDSQDSNHYNDVVNNLDIVVRSAAATVNQAVVSVTDAAPVVGLGNPNVSFKFYVREINSQSLDLATVSNAGEKSYLLDIRSRSGALQAIDAIEDAAGIVNSEISRLGSVSSRLSQISGLMEKQYQNLITAENDLVGLDEAQELANLATHQLLQQTASSMFAQANVGPQQVMVLLGVLPSSIL